MPIKHTKTNTIPDWTQTEIDAAIANGDLPPGTTPSNMTLASDWNSDHDLSTFVAADITDFDTEVSNNTDVAANTAARHAAVTLAGEDYLSLTGQQITANPIDLDNLSATGTPSSSTFLRGDNTWATPAGGVSDGDKGDITVSGSGATWTIDNDVVTYAKMQNVSATDRLLGRDTAAAGDVEELTVGGGVEFTGTGGIQTSAFTGDATKAAGGTALTLATVNSNVGTFGSATQVAVPTVNGKGLITAISNTSIAIPSTAVTDFTEAAQDAVGAMVDSTLVYSDATPSLSRAALTGDVTASAGSNATTIANDAVTNAKLRNSAALSVIGNATNAVTDPADIVAANDAEVLRRSGTAIGFGTVATGGITNNAVTFAKFQQITTDRLLGRDTAATGNAEEISVGGGIEFTGSAGIQTSAFTGDVTKTAGGTATTIANNAVSNAKFRQSAGLSVVGRSANSTGDVADITGTDGLVLRVSGTTLGFGTILTAGIADNAVTYGKMQDISATQRVLGRNTAGAGDTEEVTATQILDWLGSTRGQILYRGASAWTVLAPGTSGQLLSTGGAGADPSWITASGTGTVTSVSITQPAAGITQSGSPVTTAGSITLALANDLAALEGLSTNGLIVRTATDTMTTRTITGGGGITVTNGDGVSGNPTLSISNTKTIWVPANAITPSTSGGCATLATIATSANRPDISSLNFDSTTAEYAQFAIRFPKSWDEGTITAAFYWSHAATTTNFGVRWGLQGVAVSDDDTIDVAYGTAQEVTDTGGTTNDLYVSATTSAITIAGTPAVGDEVFFRVYRDPANAGDNMAIDARLMGVAIFYTINTLDDV